MILCYQKPHCYSENQNWRIYIKGEIFVYAIIFIYRPCTFPKIKYSQLKRIFSYPKQEEEEEELIEKSFDSYREREIEIERQWTFSETKQKD